MRFSHDHLWKLSWEELAKLCHEMGHSDVHKLDPAHEEEARRIYGGWSDALAINKHSDGGAERQANMALALRKRTIELMVRAGMTA